MPIITLADGSQHPFSHPVTVADVIARNGKKSIPVAVAAKVNGQLVDLSTLLETDTHVTVITDQEAEGLAIIRHSCAHLLAQAVKTLFPDAQVTIGPVIEDGFYYDFSYQRAFTPEDLAQIEAKMWELVAQALPIQRRVASREEATQFFRQQGEDYKAQIIEAIPTAETLSLYQQGNFTDLCRGPHVPDTGKIKAFKLTKVAGAYWRGDSKNEMLQRIYGTAWATPDDLKKYVHRLEEAEKRDHRKLGKQLDLFHLQEEAPGMAFWHARGWALYLQIQDYIRRVLREHHYQEVHTPQLLDRSLWEKSGHWDKFNEEMFTTASETRDYAVKPMNCPCHVQIYNQGLKSYRDLPLRMAEFGSCHRNEPSGTLHGLMRIRAFTQDDAHIFCTEEQVQSEVADFIDLLFKVYTDFGFRDVIIKLSTRPEKRVGSDAVWDKAEKALELALNHKNLVWELQPGQGAFYGPKIEFSLKDCLGRVWQCGTIQVDFSMPPRLGAEYIASDGNKYPPVMLHRAVLGSFERFIGILIEEHAGAFPLWLAPVQVVLLNIADRQADYVLKTAQVLQNWQFRVNVDLRNEKIGLKIREHTLQKIPYLIIVGDKEVENQTVAVRTRKGEDLGSMSIANFVEKLSKDVANHSVQL